jgi:hypothetical protein
MIGSIDILRFTDVLNAVWMLQWMDGCALQNREGSHKPYVSFASLMQVIAVCIERVKR